MADSLKTASPEQDSQFHSYKTHRIPWYVRAIWLGFWIGAIWYVFYFAVPAVKVFFK